ncbi:putative serine protease PepD [Burkholderiales bacterium]|nr:MAG: trypsin-like serine protease [Burkholderiales bacterium]CAG0985673.1 putative serine protease PepD [Burkholderiales bacterium]
MAMKLHRKVCDLSAGNGRRACALVAVALLSLLAGEAGGARPGEARQVAPRGAFTADEQAIMALFERARDSVVFISTRQEVRDFWTRNVLSVPRGNGSGFIWDEHGHVVTNFHVIKGASEAMVKLADGGEQKATLVGMSPAHDLAVLKIKQPHQPPRAVPLGSSHDLRVGQSVYAIGNPFGLDWTLTRGLISALDRSLDGGGGESIEHLIQTDAAINPGNSGGPLLDSAGRLIGVNTAIYSPSGASAGIGFAVPVDTVNRVVPQLIRHGKYLRPAIGIETDETLNRRLTELLQVKGVAVLAVRPGSPAAAAGLEGVTRSREGYAPGDIITAVDGKAVEGAGRFAARLDDYRPGDRVRLTLWRRGKSREVTITLRQGE